MTFLPENYKKPASSSRYLRLTEGEHQIRVLSNAITGWIDWQETTDGRKPVRTKEEPEQSINPNKPAKHFWAFVVWDYADNSIKILEVTQRSIQDAIYSLHSDKNWGHPKNYDLIIKRVGKGLNDTKYQVTPVPPAPLDTEITEICKRAKVDLSQLYINGDPFGEDSSQAHASSEATQASYGHFTQKSEEQPVANQNLPDSPVANDNLPEQQEINVDNIIF